MKRTPVKSASRTFAVLELFRDERRPLRLSEIYTALGYPQSSSTNLLKGMVIEGYLNYNRNTRTYCRHYRSPRWAAGFTVTLYPATGIAG